MNLQHIRRLLALTASTVIAFFTAAALAEDAKAPPQPRVATIKVIMSGIHAPHCGALGTLLKAEGPKDDKGWSEVALHAALLNESGHLLVENNRCPDGIWADAAAKLRDGTAGVFAAAGKKDLKAAQDSFTMVTAACAACHAKHRQPALQGAPVAPVAAAAPPASQPAAQAAASSPAGVPQVRVAQVRHIMAGLNGPTCATLGGSLKGDGPKADKEWADVVKLAALLNEAGFMLMENGRCPDEIWKNACAALRENSGRVAVAGGSKNLEEARVGFKGVTAACGACHTVHKKPPA
jgi:hypothetical protein